MHHLSWLTPFKSFKYSTTQIKMGLKTIEALMTVFLDPLTHEFPEELVISPYGHFYDKKTLDSHWKYQTDKAKLTTCPYTNRPLSEVDLLSGKQALALKDIFQKAKTEYDLLNKHLAEMKLPVKTIESMISQLENNLNVYTTKLRKILESIQNIDKLKETLKLSKRSDHLQFWSEQKSSFKNMSLQLGWELPLKLAGYTKMTDERGKIYFISYSVANLMEAANGDCQSYSELTEKINLTKQEQQHSFCNRLFSCLRTKAESRLLDCEIDSVDLSTFKNV